MEKARIGKCGIVSGKNRLSVAFATRFSAAVHSFYRRARLNGLWDRILEHLVKVTRQRAGLSEEPAQALIDSQSVKTPRAVEQKGFVSPIRHCTRFAVTADIVAFLFTTLTNILACK